MKSIFSFVLTIALLLPLCGVFAVSAATSAVETDNPLYQKSALFVGDSVCEAYCEWDAKGSRNASGWAGRIMAWNSMTGVNIGLSGASISNVRGSNTVINQLVGQKGNSYDYIIIEGGANDAWDVAPIGEMTTGYNSDFDVTTFAGGLEETFKYAKENFPNSIIGYIVTFQMPSANYGALSDMSGYFSMAKQICDKWEIPYLDLYFDQDFNDKFLKSSTSENLPDYIHPNTAGYDIIAPRVNAWMKTIGVESYNLALNKPVTVSGNGVGYYQENQDGSVSKYQADINDGVTFEGMGYDHNWFGFYYDNSRNTVDGLGSMVIDLQKMSDITGVRVHLYTHSGMGIGAPESITVSVSANGTDYTAYGNLTSNATDDTTYWTELSANASARYIKFEFKLGNYFCFLDEIEVYGSVAEENGAPHECVDDGNGWYYDEINHWHECNCRENLDKAAHEEGDWVVVEDAQIGIDGLKEKYCTVCGATVDSEVIPATGAAQPKGLRGDVNESGAIDARDYVLLKRAYFGTASLNEVATLLADVNNSGGIDARDYVMLKRAYFKTYEIPEDIKYVY